MAGPAGLVVMGQGRRAGRWAWLLAGILITELVFLYRVDIMNSPLLLSSIVTLRSLSLPGLQDSQPGGLALDDEWMTSANQVPLHKDEKDGKPAGEACDSLSQTDDWLLGTRDFSQHPIRVASGETEEWKSCAVPCVFKNRFEESEVPDAAFGWPDNPAQRVLRSMESSAYYADNDVDAAHRKGYDVVMTTSLSSDVPVGYFSWVEYDIMSPVQTKREDSLAAAFISNCGNHNFRLRALQGLISEGVTVHSYGACLHNYGNRATDKLEALRLYKFSLAFENSNVEDYVTEKFWQSLVAGSIPVVIGAPNIHDFEPGPNSIIYIEDEKDIAAAAKQIKHLASNETAYNDALRWKKDGPTDAFKALVDMAAVHSSCRLCIHLATRIQMKEPAANRSCNCFEHSNAMHRMFVRERGRFKMESVFIRSSKLTIEELEEATIRKFTSLNYVPVWKSERPAVIRGDNNKLKIYRIYPVNLTQREALYSWNFHTTHNLKEYVDKNPCPQFEVIFV